MPYGLFVSVLPALGAFVVLKLTKRPVSWKRVVFLYVLLFILVFIQFLVRSSLGNNKGGFNSRGDRLSSRRLITI
jgi:hypothetical protein